MTAVLDDARNPARRGVPPSPAKQGPRTRTDDNFMQRLEEAEHRDNETSKLHLFGSASLAAAARLHRSYQRRPVGKAKKPSLTGSEPRAQAANPRALPLSEACLDARRLAVDSETGITENTLASDVSDLVSTFRSSRSAGSGTLTVRKDGQRRLEVTVENQ